MNCDYLDAVLASGEMIWITRLLVATTVIALMATAAFVVASTIAHMRGRRWLTRAGTFEISEHELRARAGDRADSGYAGEDMYGELEAMRVQLALSSELIEDFMDELGR